MAKQIENAPLKPNTRLKTALTKLPSHWLEAIGRQGDLGEVRNRKDRIDALAEWLPQEENLRKIWNTLPLPSREVVNWILLERNGAVKIQNLSRRYGADTDITWWWNEGQMPETPLGLLRSKGLVYVGKIREGKRRFRIAVVPVELRKALTRIAQEPGSMEGDPSPGKSLWREPFEASFTQEDLLEAPIFERARTRIPGRAWTPSISDLFSWSAPCGKTRRACTHKRSAEYGETRRTFPDGKSVRSSPA